MATLKLAIVPAKVVKDGTHKIRVAIGHKQETRYIVTRFKIESLSHFKNGQVVGSEDSVIINVKLRNLLNEYQEKLDTIKNLCLYDCGQIREMLVNSGVLFRDLTFQPVSKRFIRELKEDSRAGYATLVERSCRYFAEFTKTDILLSEITPTAISNFNRFLRNTKKNWRNNKRYDDGAYTLGYQ